MILRAVDRAYLERISAKINAGELILKKTDHPYPDEGMMFCPECDQEIWAQQDDLHLIMVDDNDQQFIVICCEGYHPLDPSRSI